MGSIQKSLDEDIVCSPRRLGAGALTHRASVANLLDNRKGIIVAIWPEENMPVDKFGTRAELIRDGTSVAKRMNPGCLYEQYFNAQSDAIQRQLKAMKKANPDGFYDEAWELLMKYYAIVSPRTIEALNDPQYRGTKKSHIDSVLKGDPNGWDKGGPSNWLPTVSPTTLFNATKTLMREFPLDKGPVTYVGPSGRRVTTRRDVIVGSVYTIVLEKTGDEWSGVSSTKLNHFGIPAKVNRHDKYAAPARPSPVRILGESEIRLMAAAVGGETVAELVEMSNSPPLHRHMVRNLLEAEHPTAMESVVMDQNLIGVGGRNLAVLHHSFQIAGMRLVRKPAYTGEPQIYPPAEGEPSL